MSDGPDGQPAALDRTALDRDALNPLPVDVVSVQSQVVYGCVGNSVAVPTLRALGLNVVPLPTVLLSNVPHYDTLHGGAIPTEWFAGYLSDLERRGVMGRTRAILLGYLGPPEQTRVLADWLERISLEHPSIDLIVDPVIGDHDVGVYVDPGLPPLLRERIVPLANGLTPNAFEFEQLVGRPLPTLDDTISAARELLEGRAEWVVVTSAAPAEAPEGQTNVAVVTRDGTEVITHRLVETVAKGTGDLFTAHLLGRRLLGDELLSATQAAVAETIAVLERTNEHGCGELVLSAVSARR